LITFAGFAFFGSHSNVALLLGCGENSKLEEYAAVLVVHGKMSLTINIAISEKK
jgi:hypothetical protein